jgi:U2 small nuclear ribonucleoprotein A'
MNCVNQYELDLRENRITMIENLGTTEVCFSIVCSMGSLRVLGLSLRCVSLLQNQFDSIDMSDNAIVKLDGFPKLKRLTALHINNNRVMRLGPSLDGMGTHLRYDVEYQGRELKKSLLTIPSCAECLPNLEWLMLTNNKLSNVADLEPLGKFPKLRYLSLIDNPVTKQPGYRLFVINRCKKLKALDFMKISPAEREEADKEFGGKEAPAAVEQAILEPQQGSEEDGQPSIRKGPTKEQLLAIKAAIASASTIEEVTRLEEALQTGQVPSSMAINSKEDMMSDD